MNIINVNDKMKLYVEFFFEHQIIIKMFHFQTTQYGAHKASDEYLQKFLNNHDKFMEVAQGVYGKLELENIKLDIDLHKNNITTHLDIFIKFLNLINKIEKNSGLLTIKDEMLNDVNQFKYLLLFK
jgi:hypothetical protein